MGVYVDNVRLLDTKPEGASTEVTVLDSFEENLDALLPTGGRTEEPVLNDDEFFVTDGAKSAKFTLTGDGTWAQDYTIDLEQYGLLTEILALPQEERFRYSLAWDWIPEVGGCIGGLVSRISRSRRPWNARYHGLGRRRKCQDACDQSRSG